MKKRYTIDEKPTSLSVIKVRSGVGNIRFDPYARDEDGDVPIDGDWVICTAPRPIPGTVSWIDAEAFPMFWSAIDPTSGFGSGYLSRCEELDASQVVYVTEQVVKETVQAYYDDKMPGRVNVNEYPLRDVMKTFLRIKQGDL